nr:hypothetical protein BgiMline_003339 [Biomphalaria glabrata]
MISLSFNATTPDLFGHATTPDLFGHATTPRSPRQRDYLRPFLQHCFLPHPPLKFTLTANLAEVTQPACSNLTQPLATTQNLRRTTSLADLRRGNWTDNPVESPSIYTALNGQTSGPTETLS